MAGFRTIAQQTIRADRIEPAHRIVTIRARAQDSGRGYQTAINQALREHLATDELETTLRRVVREELRNVG